MPDAFILFAPPLLLFIVALLRFVGCYQSPQGVNDPNPVIQVNCGGAEVNDNTGVWLDNLTQTSGAANGASFTSVGGSPFSKMDPNIVHDKNNRPVSAIFDTCRFGDGMRYEFTVPQPGQYGVRLKFAEISPESGPRTFNFSITVGSNAPLPVTNWDITAKAGGFPFTTVDDLNALFLVGVQDVSQHIIIEFMQGPQNLPLINGIEINT